ncbi:transposase [Arthrobacter sp. GAS37]|uniref:IS110 family transposase n=1 Tax=Arthrobacter sp. GAS37 TaxID=3156261 RepID=UPI003851639B
MDVMFERVAGLDIGKKSVTVCVRTPGPGGGRHGETRTFRTMTRSLELMRDWLVGQSVTLAAMESTSTYWKRFCALEDRMECWLLNAAHMKAVPGRKTDLSKTLSGSHNCRSMACSGSRSFRLHRFAVCAC